MGLIGVVVGSGFGLAASMCLGLVKDSAKREKKYKETKSKK